MDNPNDPVKVNTDEEANAAATEGDTVKSGTDAKVPSGELPEAGYIDKLVDPPALIPPENLADDPDDSEPETDHYDDLTTDKLAAFILEDVPADFPVRKVTVGGMTLLIDDRVCRSKTECLIAIDVLKNRLMGL